MIIVSLLDFIFRWIPSFIMCFPVPGLKGAGRKTNEQRRQYIRRSLSFSPRIGVDGRLIWSEGENNIRESLIVILKPSRGTYCAAGLWCRVGRLVRTEQHSDDAHQTGHYACIDTLGTARPVESVDVIADAADLSAALATITTGLVATGSRERINVTVPLTL